MGNIPAAVADGARGATGATAARAAMERPSPVSMIPRWSGVSRVLWSAGHAWNRCIGGVQPDLAEVLGREGLAGEVVGELHADGDLVVLGRAVRRIAPRGALPYRSITPSVRPGGRGAGGSQVLVRSTCRPSREASWMASMMSSTW